MCSPFSCSSFKRWKEYDYDFDEFPAPIKTPQKSKSCRSYSFSSSTKRKDESKKTKQKKKNPYANQGLDKFAALLAELEAKKQKIYMQKGSGDISLVYFTYTNSDELQPFIVKVKKPQPQQQQPQKQQPNPNNKEKEMKPIAQVAAINKKDEEEAQRQKKEVTTQIRKITKKSFKLRNGDLRHIFGFFPMTIILILLLLCLSGRSFAIICVTVAWYLVPMLSRETNDPVTKKTK
ncbi:OLC1v1017047C1 [Oldenlandia corymbosa var. corymbosa]|uniref:OLC1v1017047C1 n=1 Tax=Oldenlandia corymbosa var. corymbosa TaxID=529605 RepID=A0AAV1E8L3_OLDCO|nr:OLC1v1017047C1 [Oldenlandia corymbosa var. corymbosa]